MDRTQALQLLGLHDDASATVIRATVAAKGSQSANDRDNYERVIEAGRALGVIGPDQPEHFSATALALRQTGELAEQQRQMLELARLGQEERKLRREQARAEVTEIVRVRVDPLRRARRRYAWLAGISGLIGAVGLLLRGLGGVHGISDEGDTLLVAGVELCLLISAFVGVLAGVGALQVQSLDGAFEDVDAALSRRATVAATLKEILGDVTARDSRQSITEHELEQAIGVWVFSRPNAVLPWPFGRRRPGRRGLYLLARRTGPRAFTQVLVSKAKESELFAEHEELDEHGNLIVGYMISVAPRAARNMPDRQLSAEEESQQT